MKLYTREEVATILEKAKIEDFQIGLMLDSMKPIELPTEEEINAYVESTPYYGSCTEEYKEGIDDGAKWVIEQIKKQK